MKRASLSIDIIIIAAIALLVLIVIVAIFAGKTGMWNKNLSSCSSKSGVCEPEKCTTGKVPVPDAECPLKGQVCCMGI